MKRCFSRVVVCGLFAAVGILSAAQSASAKSMVEYAMLLARTPANMEAYKALQFAKARLGKQVGNGECWTLAHDALDAAGAKRPGREYATYVFGKGIALSQARPGDVLQFANVKFVAKNGAWQDFTHHTAIFVERRGDAIAVIHQNVKGQRIVQYGVFRLSEQQGGTIQAFRAVKR